MMALLILNVMCTNPGVLVPQTTSCVQQDRECRGRGRGHYVDDMLAHCRAGARTRLTVTAVARLSAGAHAHAHTGSLSFINYNSCGNGADYSSD
ncbi:hypothetical protein J6590_032987 [Homalodisca vitripennis]|nr:hypothetical protein J6590_032987 [Homalodisca vitripennis]